MVFGPFDKLTNESVAGRDGKIVACIVPARRPYASPPKKSTTVSSGFERHTVTGPGTVFPEFQVNPNLSIAGNLEHNRPPVPFYCIIRSRSFLGFSYTTYRNPDTREVITTKGGNFTLEYGLNPISGNYTFPDPKYINVEDCGCIDPTACGPLGTNTWKMKYLVAPE